ncbi:uncharacterized protein JCM15063_005259 [Sporobolomyces koalae]|uniref:uncharacterized protein n=1 Tax=Sporobolomyces koalae TaxID=500713 RepID=UPI0031812C5E
MSEAHVQAAASGESTSSRKEPLALPAPPTASDAPIKLDVGTGESVSLYDRLGPTVVNSDGTLSRIVGWSEMGPNERTRILRVLGKRNAIRLEAKKDELSRAQAPIGDDLAVQQDQVHQEL